MGDYHASTADILNSLLPDETVDIHAEDGGWIRIEYSGGMLFARRIHDEIVVLRTDGFFKIYREEDDGWWYPIEEGYHFKIERQGSEIAVRERSCDDDEFGFAVVVKIGG